MRTRFWLLGLGLGLALANSAQAQQRSIFLGVDPTKINNQPINTNNASASIATTQTVSTGFSLSKYFPSFSMSGSKPTIGRSNFPTFGQMPGRDYLKSFGWNNFQAFK
jgi:hypothetical protein